MEIAYKTLIQFWTQADFLSVLWFVYLTSYLSHQHTSYFLLIICFSLFLSYKLVLKLFLLEFISLGLSPDLDFLWCLIFFILLIPDLFIGLIDQSLLSARKLLFERAFFHNWYVFSIFWLQVTGVILTTFSFSVQMSYAPSLLIIN